MVSLSWLFIAKAWSSKAPWSLLNRYSPKVREKEGGILICNYITVILAILLRLGITRLVPRRRMVLCIWNFFSLYRVFFPLLHIIWSLSSSNVLLIQQTRNWSLFLADCFQFDVLLRFSLKLIPPFITCMAKRYLTCLQNPWISFDIEGKLIRNRWPILKQITPLVSDYRELRRSENVCNIYI